MLIFKKSKLVKNSNFFNNRAEGTILKIESYLKKRDKILDVGCGGCHIIKKDKI